LDQFYNNKLEKVILSFTKTFEEFSVDLATNALIDNTILIKGSRGLANSRFYTDDFFFSQYFRKSKMYCENRLIFYDKKYDIKGYLKSIPFVNYQGL
jgi:hypothetical protein